MRIYIYIYMYTYITLHYITYMSIMEASPTPALASLFICALFCCKLHGTSEHHRGLILILCWQVAQHLVVPAAASSAPQYNFALPIRSLSWNKGIKQFSAILQEIVWGGQRLNITVPICSACWIKAFETVLIWAKTELSYGWAPLGSSLAPDLLGNVDTQWPVHVVGPRLVESHAWGCSPRNMAI